MVEVDHQIDALVLAARRRPGGALTDARDAGTARARCATLPAVAQIGRQVGAPEIGPAIDLPGAALTHARNARAAPAVLSALSAVGGVGREISAADSLAAVDLARGALAYA